MAQKKFKLEIVSPEQVELSDEVVSLIAPGTEGYIGIMANHAPLVTELKVGELRISWEHVCRYLAISGGFMEVSGPSTLGREGNKVTILADACERADEIDVERAKAAAERARKRLDGSQAGMDHHRAQAALTRATNRLRIADKPEERL
jgi:F-type H+-transporting ATPase subunit epsilon